MKYTAATFDFASSNVKMMINGTISVVSLHVCRGGCRIGRVKIMRFSSLCQFVLGVSIAFSGNYYLFMVLRFLLAMVSEVLNYYRRDVLVFSARRHFFPGYLSVI